MLPGANRFPALPAGGGPATDPLVPAKPGHIEKDYQRIINKMGRATTGTFQSTPLGIVMAESKLASAGPLPDFCQASFMKRLMARPKGNHGPEEILGRRGAELAERLRQSSFLGKKENPEEFKRAEHRRFPGEMAIEPKGES